MSTKSCGMTEAFERLAESEMGLWGQRLLQVSSVQAQLTWCPKGTSILTSGGLVEATHPTCWEHLLETPQEILAPLLPLPPPSLIKGLSDGSI